MVAFQAQHQLYSLQPFLGPGEIWGCAQPCVRVEVGVQMIQKGVIPVQVFPHWMGGMPAVFTVALGMGDSFPREKFHDVLGQERRIQL